MVLTFALASLVRRSATANPRLPEGEDVRLGARLAEGDLQRPLENLALLTDELVAAAAAERAVAVGVGVGAVRRTRGPAVDQHPERYRLAAPGRHHQIRVPRLEAEGDAPARVVEGGLLLLDGPVAGHGPLVEPQAVGDPVEPALRDHAAGRGEALAAPVAQVRLGRAQMIPVGRRLD